MADGRPLAIDPLLPREGAAGIACEGAGRAYTLAAPRVHLS